MEKTEPSFYQPVKAILFDLDGTLMETDDQAAERVARILSRFRVAHPAPLAKKLVMWAETPVNGLITLLDHLGLDAPLMSLFHKVSRGSGQKEYGFRMMSGVKPMLGQLKQRYRLAVVTTRSQAEAEGFLTENGLEELFDVVVSRSSTWRLKPHPEPVSYAAKQLGVAAENCLMVGDTVPDMRSARRAGALPLGVLCGYGDRGELLNAGAAFILEHTSLTATLPLLQDSPF